MKRTTNANTVPKQPFDAFAYIYFFMKDEVVHDYFLKNSKEGKISLSYTEIQQIFGFKSSSNVHTIIKRLLMYGLIKKVKTHNRKSIYQVFDFPEKKPSRIIHSLASDLIEGLDYKKVAVRFDISQEYARFLTQQIKAKATYLARMAAERENGQEGDGNER